MPKLRPPGPTYVKQSAEIGSQDRVEEYRDRQKLGEEIAEEDVEPIIKGGMPGKNNAAQP